MNKTQRSDPGPLGHHFMYDLNEISSVYFAGCNEMRAKFDASHNESLDTPKPFNESVISMFDGDSGDDTDDYMDFEEGIDIGQIFFIS